MPKDVSILPDLPLTPIGKIYKPALRVLATTRAVEDALSGAGLAPKDFEISTSEAKTIIEIRDEVSAEAVKRALLGMPIRYEIRLAGAQIVQ